MSYWKTAEGQCADDCWHELGQVRDFEEAERLADAWEARTGGVILKVRLS